LRSHHASLNALSLVLAVAALLAGAAPSHAADSPAAGPLTPNAADDARHSHDPLRLTPALGMAAPLRAVGGPGVPRREVMGFAPYWALTQEGRWRYDLMTTVAYFGVDVTRDGHIDMSPGNPGWKGWNSQQLVAVIDAAHRSGVRVVLVIKQFDEASIHDIVTDPATTRMAAASVVKLLAARNLDGVNVDFEGRAAPNFPGMQDGVVAFMGELGREVHQWRGDATVTIDTYSGAASWDGGIFNIGRLAPVVDAFFVMAYDMAPSNSCCRAGPGAPLGGYSPYNDQVAVTQYLSRAPASKVILGVPLYGNKWSTRDASPNSATTSGPEPDSYADAMADIRCAQDHHLQLAGPSWDAPAGTRWFAWVSPARDDPCGGNRNGWRELYYEDPDSLALKYDLVVSSNLRGAGLWALGYEGGMPEPWNVLSAKLG
jgi:spore germination protein YaaH